MPRTNINDRAGLLLDTWGRRNRRHKDRNCLICGKVFRPRKVISKCCSKRCGYLVRLRKPAEQIAERFWDKVNKLRGCWEWDGWKSRSTGYGGYSANGKQDVAHRWAWQITNGAIPAGQHVLHKCDNKICVNPAHLYLGNARQNYIDMMARQGHEYFGKCGEKNHQSRYTAKDINRLRVLSATIQQKSLAKLFAMSKGNVSRIINRTLWRHI